MLYEVPEKRSYENMYMLLIEYAKPQKRFFPSLWQTGSRKDKELFFFFFFFLDSTFEEFTKICKPTITQNTLRCKQNTHYIYSVPVTAC